jgi:hypothetical protein
MISFGAGIFGSAKEATHKKENSNAAETKRMDLVSGVAVQHIFTA